MRLLTMAHGPDTEELLQRVENARDTLDVGLLNITSLPPLPAGLKELKCFDTNITTLPPLPAGLELLYAWGTQLTSLPELPATLKELYISDTNITSLPPLPTGLIDLNCSETQLTSLPPLPSTLQGLKCSETPLTSLPELPPTLTELICRDTPLTSLPPLPPSLEFLDITNTRIRVEDIPDPLPPNLEIESSQDDDEDDDRTMEAPRTPPPTAPSLVPPPAPSRRSGPPSTLVAPSPPPMDITPPVVQPKEVFYTEEPMCYHIVEIEDMSVLQAISQGDVVFKLGNSYIATDLGNLQQELNDRTTIRFKCNRELHGAPRMQDVDGTEYYLLQLTGNLFVNRETMRNTLGVRHSVFELVDTGTIFPYTTSAANVYANGSYDRSILGNRINTINTDHCNAGTQRQLYEVLPIVLKRNNNDRMIEGGKKKKSRKTRRAKKVSRRRGRR